MVVNTLTHHLMEAGLTEYEARAYIALLREGPLTAYELARRAGIPTSKIYGVVGRLAERGVFTATGEGRRRSYVPMDAAEFVEGLKGRVQNTITQIEGGLMDVARRGGSPRVLNLRGRDYIVEKAARLISGARLTLLVSLWKEEMADLHPALAEAEKKHIKCAVVHFGPPSLRAGAMYQHPGGRPEGDRGLVVVADSREALSAAFRADGSAEGATSANGGFVSLAEDYIRHDIYMTKLLRRFDREFRKHFGPGYEKLTDVFEDEASTS